MEREIARQREGRRKETGSQRVIHRKTGAETGRAKQKARDSECKMASLLRKEGELKKYF